MHCSSDITTEKVISRRKLVQTSRRNIMLTQDNRSEKQTASEYTTLINRIMMWCPYTSNNTYQDTQNLNHKTYRIEKLKFPEIYTKIIHKPIYRLDSQHRTKNVPKTYRNPKKRTKRYLFKDQKCNVLSRN